MALLPAGPRHPARELGMCDVMWMAPLRAVLNEITHTARDRSSYRSRRPCRTCALTTDSSASLPLPLTHSPCRARAARLDRTSHPWARSHVSKVSVELDEMMQRQFEF